MSDTRVVGRSVRKKDAMQLLLGKPVYTDDIVPQNKLCVKLLRSPHANALIADIDTSRALALSGVEAVYTYHDVPARRFSNAGQTYPAFSPNDHLILDRHVRYVGDPVAIIAADSEKTAEKAMKLIRVKYEILPAVLDVHDALDDPTVVHPEDNWNAPVEVGGDRMRNLVASGCDAEGDVEGVLSSCPVVIDRTYHTKAFQQVMAETFRTYCEIDVYGRLHVISSTQIVFHCRRILSEALGIPVSRIRVEKPRIGGGFGAKQTAISEVYPAFVTWKTGKPCELIFTREECMIAGSPRHEMEIRVRLGADKDGRIRAMDLYTLSNTGAYGEHGPTTVGLSGHKTIPLYSAGVEAYRFRYDVVYTNLQPAGAYRGYGATQGMFAVESAVNELAETLGMDPTRLRDKNMVREGMLMKAYYGETVNACHLDGCMDKCRRLFGWDEKYPVRDMGNGRIRAAGVAMAMQGSGISKVDVGSATVKLAENGTYVLVIGAADMGTGCDTTLAQIVAENMDCSLDDVAVRGADTDISPYDSGSYASSTAYVTGKAVERACDELKQKICRIAAEMLGCEESQVDFCGRFVRRADTDQQVSLTDVGYKGQFFNNQAAEATVTHSSPVSPPPFMVGMAEVEVDTWTGKVEVLNYTAVVDCGTPLNPNLVKIQTEGGLAQGIGHTLFEDVQYDPKGRPIQSSLLQYKIPTRMDVGHLHVDFDASYEKTGPNGAKSIGEVVINTPAPAIAHAIYRATGVWHRSLPIRPEDIALSAPEL